MLIVVKQVKEEFKPDGSPKLIEWEVLSVDGRKSKVKIYPAIQIDEQWLHLEDRWSEFRNAQHKTYDIEQANVKAAKGFWRPLIKAIEVKDIPQKQAIAQVQEQEQDNTRVSIEAQVAIKEIGENWRIGKFVDTDKELEIYRIWIIDRLNKSLFGGKSEVSPPKEIQSSQTSVERQGEGERVKVRAILDLAGEKHWRRQTLDSFIKNTLHIAGTLEELSDEELSEIQKALTR